MTRAPRRPAAGRVPLTALAVLLAAALTACGPAPPDGPDRSPAPTSRTPAGSTPADGSAPTRDGDVAGDDDGPGPPVPDPPASDAPVPDAMSGTASPHAVLGPGTPLGPLVAGGPDVAAVVAATADPSVAGADAAATWFQAAWLHGVTTGDRTLVDVLGASTCTFCRTVGDRVVDTPLRPEDGYRIEMTTWPTDVTTGDGTVVHESVLHVLTMYEQALDNGTPVLHVVQDEARVLTAELRYDRERWTVAGLSSDPWTATSGS